MPYSYRLLFSAADALIDATSTGLAFRSTTKTFYLLDWKSKFITEFTLAKSNDSSSTSSSNHSEIQIQHRISSDTFNEPVQIAIFDQHPTSLLIRDNESLLIIDSRTGQLINKIDTRAFGIKTIKAFTIGSNDEILIGDHRIHIVSYDGKYIRQIPIVNQQQTVDVDIHITHQPPDLIASHHKQMSSNNSFPSKANTIGPNKSGGM